MAINDTLELIVQGELNVNGAVQTYIHTLHFRSLTVPVGITPEAALINAWQAAARTAWMALHTNTYNLVELIARQTCGSLPLRAPATEADTAAGARTAPAGEVAAHWLSCVVTERTDLSGRTRRGRFFVSGLYEADLTGNTITSTFTSLVNAYNAALMAAFGPAGTNADFALVVHSRKLAAQPGTQCQDSSRLVTALVTRNKLTTQKSRKPRTFA